MSIQIQKIATALALNNDANILQNVCRCMMHFTHRCVRQVVIEIDAKKIRSQYAWAANKGRKLCWLTVLRMCNLTMCNGLIATDSSSRSRSDNGSGTFFMCPQQIACAINCALTKRSICFDCAEKIIWTNHRNSLVHISAIKRGATACFTKKNEQRIETFVDIFIAVKLRSRHD